MSKPAQNAVRAWVRMPSGKRLDLLDPTPFDWDDADLALGLARTYRWGGHSRWDLPLSVAQHSLTVMAIHQQLLQDSGAQATPAASLRELLHDADEGLIGFDCLQPVKPFLGEQFQILSQRLQDVVFLRYGMAHWKRDEFKLHKQADRIAAASEAVHVVGWSLEEVRKTLKISEQALAADPLHALYGGTAWEPWPPALAQERFLVHLNRLKLLDGAA